MHLRDLFGETGDTKSRWIETVNEAGIYLNERLIKARFPDQQLIFTRDLPELYATGLPALNVFLKTLLTAANENNRSSGKPWRAA
jgi:DNA-binding winged helix-turn-helix (wHTH) protein